MAENWRLNKSLFIEPESHFMRLSQTKKPAKAGFFVWWFKLRNDLFPQFRIMVVL